MLFYVFNRFVTHPVFRGIFVCLDNWFFCIYAPVALPSPLSPSHHLGSSLNQSHGRSACGLYGRY